MRIPSSWCPSNRVKPTSCGSDAFRDSWFLTRTKDERIAKALIEFLRVALAIPFERVRCTSVDAYKLSAGVPTEFELRREIHESRCFIGLVTPNSLKSSFVLFELGARWGSGARLIPVLAGQQKASELRPPLSNLNAPNCEASQEMHQLVHELARELGKRVPLPASYESQLNALLEAAELQSVQAAAAVASQLNQQGDGEHGISKATASLAGHDNRWFLDFAKHFYPQVNQAVTALLKASSFDEFARVAGGKMEIAPSLEAVKSRLDKEGFTSRNETFSGVSIAGDKMVSKPKSIYGIHRSGAVLMCPMARRTFEEIHQELLRRSKS